MEPLANLVASLFPKHEHGASTSTSKPLVRFQSVRFDTSAPTPPSVSNSSISGVSSAEPSQPGALRISSINSDGKGGGPAFVGQVFSMCDLSGTGLMAVSTHFDIPFLSQSSPEWLKKIFSPILKNERKGPVFRFFMDLGDAVSYVKKLNIPSGVVGACRLDLAYEHFKEKPHLFQFVPNERQVKAANHLLRKSPSITMKKVDGVPIFSSENLDIAIATSNGIKWYTPYFFDKAMLDNILEDSTDQHFHGLIQSRHMQRRHDTLAIEELNDSMIEPPEVQEVLDEMGQPSIPLSVVSKAAEIELFYAIDKLLLGHRWLRKATGIQPKYPYMVDTFERRTTTTAPAPSPGPKPPVEPSMQRLPKITMVGISTGDAGGQVTKATVKKAMEDLTKELEHCDDKRGTNECTLEERDPLFVANVGDFYSGLTKTNAPRGVSGRGN